MGPFVFSFLKPCYGAAKAFPARRAAAKKARTIVRKERVVWLMGQGPTEQTQTAAYYLLNDEGRSMVQRDSATFFPVDAQ